jgi:hypothetical protein
MIKNFISDSSSDENEPSFVESILDQRANDNGGVDFLVKWSGRAPIWEDSKLFYQESKQVAYFLRDIFSNSNEKNRHAETQTEECDDFQNPKPELTFTDLELQIGGDIVIPEIASIPKKIDQIANNKVFYVDNGSKQCTMDALQFSEEYPVIFSDFIMERLKNQISK